MAKSGRDALVPALFRHVLALLPEGEAQSVDDAVRTFRRFVIRASATRLLAEWGLPAPAGAILFELDTLEMNLENSANTEVSASLDAFWSQALCSSSAPRPPELLGACFEELLGYECVREGRTLALGPARGRKRTGSFYTPARISTTVVSEALRRVAGLARSDASTLAICDPACGAGAFLIEVARALEAEAEATARERGVTFDRRTEVRAILRSLYGIDTDPIALGVAQIALAVFARDPELEAAALGHLRVGDALLGRGFSPAEAGSSGDGAVDFDAEFPELCGRGFDLVIGNPPWMAFAGRAAQPLAPLRRRKLRERFLGFRGYPTLHGAFVERATALAPRGIVALLVPSPLADLDGYRPLRRALVRSHAVCEPMLEFGQDAFREVTQPCFALVARPLAPGEASSEPPDRPFSLLERERRDGVARALAPPAVLERLARGEVFPRELFGEMGFQTTRAVSERLLRRADAPDALHTYPLLEGRVVSEFVVGKPALFLRPDVELLRRERCRLRPLEDYRRACFVVRQTAKMPIAALHTSRLPFRNTLLAGFECDALPPDFLVGLLNSTLYRALHVARQRDARQAAFPQVKIAHLRSLPRPPAAAGFGGVRELVQRATESGPTLELKRRLDDAVFDLFGLAREEREAVRGFVRERLPELRKEV